MGTGWGDPMLGNSNQDQPANQRKSMITQHRKHSSPLLVTICILALGFVALSMPMVSCTPAEQTTTFEPIVITGTANDTSQPFRASTEEWLANWSYVPLADYAELAVFQFFVYPEGVAAMFEGFMISPGVTSGSYVHAGAGEYYIKIVADNVKSWEIVISPP